MHFFLKFLLLVLAVFSMPVLANQWTDSEIKAMPPYCAARLYKDPGSVEYWKGVLGPGYLHIHHYCYAIGYINRHYSARTGKGKGSNLTDALGNIDYVLRAFSPTHSLIPEIYMNRGLVLSLLKKDGAAIIDLLKAIEMNPKLTRAYSMAADHYVKLKKQDEALSLATNGLRHNPESTVLQRLYKKLGGQLPYPEPVNQQARIPEAGAMVESKPQPDIKADKEPVPDVQAPAPPMEDAIKNESERPAVDASQGMPKIGSPSNPWCRFCPPESGQ